MPAIIVFILFVFTVTAAEAKCYKVLVCDMAGKMNLFAILDKCTMAGPMIAECKSDIQLLVKDLPEPQFIEYLR